MVDSPTSEKKFARNILAGEPAIQMATPRLATEKFTDTDNPVGNPQVVQTFYGKTDRLERELRSIAQRKLKLIVSLQRNSTFTKEEHKKAQNKLGVHIISISVP